MNRKKYRFIFAALILVVGIQAYVLIRTVDSRRELSRLRSEVKMWAATQRIKPGMHIEDVTAILGEPQSRLPGAMGYESLLYSVEPTWLPDSGPHISGCTVRLTNNVVFSCSLSVAAKAQ